MMPRDVSSEGSTVNEKPTTQRVAEPGSQPRKRSALVYVLGFVALAVLPVLALNSLATADTAATAGYGYGAAASTRHHARPHLTPALRQCLAAHGVTLPTDSPGTPRVPLTPAQRDAFRAAAVVCGVPAAPSRGQPAPSSS
jgi:hypothetical protein